MLSLIAGEDKHPLSVRRMQFDDVEELDGGANRNRGKDGDRLRRLAEAGSPSL
jgi:hypothetical protein